MANPLPAGWEQFNGNPNLVKNSQTGQVLSTSMDAWKKIAGANPAPAASPAGAPVDQANNINQQAQNAQTYSQTPGAAPTQNTTNQGTQDVVRNSYLQRATQGTNVTVDDPAVRAQLEPFAAAQERARRQYLTEAAERNSARGLGNSGAMENERRYAAEQAGQNVGLKASDLVGRELQSRRDEISDALQNLGGMISADQARALQSELAKIDAQLKQQQISQEGSIANRELGLKDKLGMAGINVDLLQALLQNQQFGVDAGIRIGDLEAKYSPYFWS